MGCAINVTYSTLEQTLSLTTLPLTVVLEGCMFSICNIFTHPVGAETHNTYEAISISILYKHGAFYVSKIGAKAARAM